MNPYTWKVTGFRHKPVAQYQSITHAERTVGTLGRWAGVLSHYALEHDLSPTVWWSRKVDIPCPAPSTYVGLRIRGILGHHPAFAAEISQLLKPSSKPEVKRQLPLCATLGKFSKPASLSFLFWVVGTVILPAPWVDPRIQ